MTLITVASGRAQLAAEATGRGGAVLMIHAGVTDRTSWDSLVARLGDGFRTVRFDARGYGETAYETEDGWSPVADALAVLDACEPGAAVVIGCSMGGRTALDLTLGHPDRVSALVLIAPAVSGSPAPVLAPRVAELDQLIDAADADGDVDEVNRLEAIVWLDGPERPGRASHTARERFLAMNGVALRAADPGEQSEPGDAWTRLGDIAVPTLVIVGDLDLEHIRRYALHVAASIPNATFLELRDVAHLPHLEAHDGALDAVAGFLAAR
ncbi:alpha/beta hydrolase [Microbacterium sp. LWH10-1.2]|uniref:alpha/beta fold hydrolase n=1 Tax=Microbacterium sp. LWH10-1.2 TaxID=3135255 RepID=UPI0031397F02